VAFGISQIDGEHPTVVPISASAGASIVDELRLGFHGSRRKVPQALVRLDLLRKHEAVSREEHEAVSP